MRVPSPAASTIARSGRRLIGPFCSSFVSYMRRSSRNRPELGSRGPGPGYWLEKITGLCYGRDVANPSSRPSTVDDTSPDELLAGSLRMAIMRLARRLRAERADDTLGLSQMSALSSLMHGPLSPTALAQVERIQPPSMTRVISAL